MAVGGGWACLAADLEFWMRVRARHVTIAAGEQPGVEPASSHTPAASASDGQAWPFPRSRSAPSIWHVAPLIGGPIPAISAISRTISAQAPIFSYLLKIMRFTTGMEHALFLC